MAKRLTAKEKQRRASARKQARLNTNYERMLSQARDVFHDATLGKYGISFESYLKYAGVGLNLKRPSEKTLKNLKKIQSKEDALKIAQRLVLRQRIGREQSKKLAEIRRRIKGEETYKEIAKLNDIGSRELAAIQKIRLFLQSLDDFIYSFSSGNIDDKTKYEGEIVKNAKRVYNKTKETSEEFVRRIQQYKDDEMHFGDYSDALTGLVLLGYNIEAFTHDHGTFEYSMFYDSTVSTISSILFERIDEFI